MKCRLVLAGFPLDVAKVLQSRMLGWRSHPWGQLLALKLATTDDYMEVLSVFAASANDKADEIERLLKDEDYKHFTLKVHSLKTVTKLVGALNLSAAAVELEAAGKNGDIETIKEKTPKFLGLYRALAEHLAVLADEVEDNP